MRALMTGHVLDRPVLPPVLGSERVLNMAKHVTLLEERLLILAQPVPTVKLHLLEDRPVVPELVQAPRAEELVMELMVPCGIEQEIQERRPGLCCHDPVTVLGCPGGVKTIPSSAAGWR